MYPFSFHTWSRVAAITLLSLAIPFTAQASNAVSAQGKDPLNQPLSPLILKNLESASRQGLTSTRAPFYTAIQSIQGPNQAHLKSGVLYIGADFCPFCAALRWPLTIALMRFGHFTGLKTMKSGAHDVYPNTSTLTYAGSRYVSKYVDFTPIEASDREGHPLDPLKGSSKSIYHRFDSEPYTSHTGGIPFLYIGGQWILLGSPVNPKLYAKLDWSQIASKLANPHNPLTKIVMPQANLITAAICQTTHQQPTEVCKAKGVQAAASMLPPMS